MIPRSTEEDQPESKGAGCRQTGVDDHSRPDSLVNVHADEKEMKAYGHEDPGSNAQEPRGKEGSNEAERRSALAAGQGKRGGQAQHRSEQWSVS
jgi:hypothetical protein